MAYIPPEPKGEGGREVCQGGVEGCVGGGGSRGVGVGSRGVCGGREMSLLSVSVVMESTAVSARTMGHQPSSLDTPSFNLKTFSV